jgi:cell division protease FtsH
VAESAVFKDVSTGSSSDIRQATDLAHRLVTQFGMSDRLGPRTFGKIQELIFLGREISTEKDYSEKTGNIIDEEIDNLINKALNTAKSIVLKYRAALDAIAQALIQKETLEQEEFYKIIKSYNLKPVAVKR